MSTHPTQVYHLSSDSTFKTTSQTNAAIIEHKLPLCILKIIRKHARDMAALSCAMINHGTKLTDLQKHITDGTIPNHHSYKFKKMFIGDNEAAIRATVIKATIEAEKAEIVQRNDDSLLKFNQRVTTLTTILEPILKECNMIMPLDALKLLLDYEINCFKAQFLLKQKEDDAKKIEKQRKYNEYKEKLDAEVIISQRDFTKANKSIAMLQKQVKQLTMKQNKAQGKAKGVPGKKKPSGPATPQNPKQTKSTGTGKGSGGKGKSTARNKKSHGKNGKQ
jgi:hypothetical protein